MNIFLEHEVSVLSCFFLLFQFCTEYVNGNTFLLYALRIINHVALFPCNLIKCRKNMASVIAI